MGVYPFHVMVGRMKEDKLQESVIISHGQIAAFSFQVILAQAVQLNQFAGIAFKEKENKDVLFFQQG